MTYLWKKGVEKDVFVMQSPFYSYQATDEISVIQDTLF